MSSLLYLHQSKYHNFYIHTKVNIIIFIFMNFLSARCQGREVFGKQMSLIPVSWAAPPPPYPAAAWFTQCCTPPPVHHQ